MKFQLKEATNSKPKRFEVVLKGHHLGDITLNTWKDAPSSDKWIFNSISHYPSIYASTKGRLFNRLSVHENIIFNSNIGVHQCKLDNGHDISLSYKNGLVYVTIDSEEFPMSHKILYCDTIEELYLLDEIKGLVPEGTEYTFHRNLFHALEHLNKQHEN